jgi:drug/metabolite transporter (DMT)-like permease
MGPMSVLSPVTAVTSAVLPVLVGLALGERLPPLAVVGVVLALGAVVLVSVAPGSAVSRPTRAALLVALAAGVAIALQLVTLAAAPDDSGVVVLVVARAVACAVLVAAVVGSPVARAAGRPPVALAVGSGALDALANLAFLLAARQGQLGIAAVVTALYPAATVLLARFVLAERLHRLQVGGLLAAGAAVALLALA